MYEEGLISSQLEEKSKKRIPFSCHLDLTYRCNLKCVHCYVVQEDRPELDTGQVKAILDELADAGTLYLHLSGGEVLLREDFFEIASYARKLHFALDISTNGTLINDEIADKIADLSPFKVKITVFSPNPQTHDAITRGSGSLEQAIHAIKLLKNRGVAVHISDILMKPNINDYHEVYEIAKKLGAEFKADQNVTPKINGDLAPLQYQISDEDLYRVLTDPLLRPTNYESEDYPHSSSFYDDVACDAALSFFYISPYGDVFPCVQFPFLCGNLLDTSFSEIWNNSSQMLYASNIRISNINECSNCKLSEYCSFCPGLALMEGVDMLSSYQRACKEAEILSKVDSERKHG